MLLFTQTSLADTSIGGKSAIEWELEWKRLPEGFDVAHPDHRRKVGLFRAVRNGAVVAIGAGTQVPGGIEKRLSDFRRDSAHNRSHHMGEMIHEYIEELELEVLVTGSDRRAADVAKSLRKAMVALHRPEWNIRRSYRPKRPAKLPRRPSTSTAHIVVPSVISSSDTGREPEKAIASS